MAAIDALQECSDYAGKRGVFVGVENHGNLTSTQVLEIVKGVESKWFSVNLDTGSFHSKDPYADLEECVPSAVNIQLKTMMKNDKGKVFPADLERISSILKKAKYQGFVVLEYEEKEALQNNPKVLTELREDL